MSLPAVDLTSSASKKRKHEERSEHVPPSLHKKVKKDGKEKSKKYNKGKRREGEAEGEFKVINASVVLSIPPRFAMDAMTGVKEMLDSLIMRYVPALRGVMLCHSNARFLSTNAVIKNECPFLNCSVAFDATVWSPQIGMKLTGRINLSSPDHISLLVHRTFNVSIPRHHIPADSWEFEHGPAENDPEFGPGATEFGTKADGNVADAMDVGEKSPSGTEEEQVDGGSWIHKITAEKLGGIDRRLKFTVVGLTVANQMLSLLGSIQLNPFSSEHTPQPAVSPSVRPPVEEAPLAAVDDELDELDLPPRWAGSSEDDDDGDEGTFGALSRAAGDAAKTKALQEEREAVRSKQEKKNRKKEKKEKGKGVAKELRAEVETTPRKKRKKNAQE